MKKFYTFLVGAMLATCANAQQLQAVSPQWQLHAPQTALHAPQKAASLENTDIWGYYLNDDVLADGNIRFVGNGSAGTSICGMRVPCNVYLKGSQIQGVRLPIVDPSCVTSCRVIVYKKDAKTVLVNKTVAVKTLAAGFNDVVLDEPFTINEDVYVAFSITTTGGSDEACYPIMFDSTTQRENSLVIFSGDGRFTDYGVQFGALCMQLYLSDVALEGYTIDGTAFGGYTMAGKEAGATVTFDSNSEYAISELDYTVSVAGGEAEENHVSVSVPRGLNKSFSFPITYTAPEEAGNYTVEVKVTKVNGTEEGLKSTAAVGTLANFAQIHPRKVVMEEMTGTGCPWCPGGIAGMEKARKVFGEDFIGIAYHIYNNSDPMYPTAFPYLGWSVAPSCFLDRNGVEMNPYYGTANDICDDIRACLEVPAYVNLNATADFNEEISAVDVNVEIEANIGGKYELVYQLVADGLTGSEFVQINNYAGYPIAQVGVSADDPLALFCRGGKYGQTYCKPIFNDVSIAASYNSNKSVGGTVTLATGEKKNASYTLKMPVKKKLPEKDKGLVDAIKNADYDVYAVVIAVKADGTVGNAQRVAVGRDAIAGIDNVTTTEDATEVARYTVDGRRISNTVPGINVVRMSDGSCRKVMVK